VRVTETNKTFVRQCLDSGADGIIFSTIETEEDAKLAIDITNYPPLGKRGLGLVRENFWGDEDFCWESPVIIAQIETLRGMNNLSNIYNSFGFNFNHFMVGPYDLSLSIGLEPGNLDSVDFKEIMKKFNTIIPSEKRGFHIVKNISRKEIEKYKDYGFIALGIDTLMLIDSLNEIKKEVL